MSGVTSVRSFCSQCRREVSVAADLVHVVLPGSATRWAGFASIRCPRCSTQINIEPGLMQLVQLCSAGAHLVRCEPPSRHAGGPPLTEDDLITLGRALAAEGETVPPPPRGRRGRWAWS